MVNIGDYRLITFYNGEAHRNPEINFNRYADQLCKIATQPMSFMQDESIISAEGAFTMGIFGSWGSGKTTLMRKMQRQLDARFNGSNSKTIWFNPWKYEGKEEIWNALIQTILREIANDKTITETRRKSILEICERLALYAGRIGAKVPVALIEKFTGVSLSEDIGLDLKQLFGEDVNDPYCFINRFEEGFGNAVNDYVGPDGKLIVFVDDLDRCLPENALTVLESLKLYLDRANCVFIIGLDKRVIEQAVKQRYKSLVGVTGKEYIEKMIQLNFFLPEKDPIEVKRILQVGLNARYAENHKMWKLIQDATRCNVRKVKQFTIAFHIIEEIAIELRIEKTMYDKLAKILLIQMNFPNFLDALLNNNSLLKKFEIIFKAEDNDLDKVKAVLANDLDGKRFNEDDHLLTFLMENNNYPKGLSEAEEMKKMLQILSVNGNTARPI
jgi:hypothetical protein